MLSQLFLQVVPSSAFSQFPHEPLHSYAKVRGSLDSFC